MRLNAMADNSLLNCEMIDAPSWQKRRGEFNHDWMKNKYIQELERWMNVLDGSVENANLEKTFVRSILPQWQAHQAEAFSLPVDCETEMSPKRLFEVPPLAKCDADTKEWLGELVHQLWLVNYRVKQLISEAVARANKTEKTYKNLQRALKKCKNTDNAETLRPLRALFDELLKDCRSLAEAIEKFPSEVKPF
ncbi:MAG: hypothetical protein Q7J31_04480 [Syntrophales bacterium]|nr:hypothetical protein [Syntrophales bacterium]